MADLKVPWEIIKRQGRQEVDSKQDSKVGVIKRRYPDNKYDVAVENIGTAGTCLLRISTAKPEDVYNVGDSVIIDFPQGKIAYAQIRGRSNITIPEEEEYIFGISQDLIYLTFSLAYSLAIYTTEGVSSDPSSFSLGVDLINPRATATDGTYFYIATNNGIYKYDIASGVKSGPYGSNGTGAGQFQSVRDILYSSGYLYVTDIGRYKVIKYSVAGSYITEWGGNGSADGKFNYPWGIDADSSGNIWVADRNNERIQKFNSAGTFLAKYTAESPKCYGLAIDEDNNVYVTDYDSVKVFKYSAAGSYLSSFSVASKYAYCLEVDGDGNVYVGMTVPDKIQKYDSSGVFVKEWSTSTPSGLLFISG